MISAAIQQLVNYGLDTGLILSDDEIYIRNQLLMTMQLDSFTGFCRAGELQPLR